MIESVHSNLSILFSDFSSLWPKTERRKFKGDVLNGISVSSEDNVIYMTGKLNLLILLTL